MVSRYLLLEQLSAASICQKSKDADALFLLSIQFRFGFLPLLHFLQPVLAVIRRRDAKALRLREMLCGNISPLSVDRSSRPSFPTPHPEIPG